jgi:hypothetical protein
MGLRLAQNPFHIEAHLRRHVGEPMPKDQCSANYVPDGSTGAHSIRGQPERGWRWQYSNITPPHVNFQRRVEVFSVGLTVSNPYGILSAS